jgi:hypothetical protein
MGTNSGVRPDLDISEPVAASAYVDVTTNQRNPGTASDSNGNSLEYRTIYANLALVWMTIA